MKRRVKRHTVCQPLDKPFRYIALTQGKVTIVDAADYEWLSKFNWIAQQNHMGYFYAMRRGLAGTNQHMHMSREILGCQPGEYADHISHDTLDNRRKNLRKATNSQNHMNQKVRRDSRSRYKGVCRHGRRWQATIRIGGKQKTIGSFDSCEDAARAYDDAALILFGEFAHLNFPT